jgi:hypothetical protein
MENCRFGSRHIIRFPVDNIQDTRYIRSREIPGARERGYKFEDEELRNIEYGPKED